VLLEGNQILVWGSLTIEVEKGSVGIETVSKSENVQDFVEVLIRNNWGTGGVHFMEFLFKVKDRIFFLNRVNASDIFNNLEGSNCLLRLTAQRRLVWVCLHFGDWEHKLEREWSHE
jgi:hypothetical protein